MNQRTNAGDSSRSQAKIEETIIRTADRDDPFARIPKDVLDHPKMSFKAKGILCYLLGKPPGWKLRRSDLAKHGKDGRESIDAGLRELRGLGYANLAKVLDKKGRVIEWKWRISDSPIFPQTGFPDVEKPDVENPSISKKERSDTDCSENAVSKESEGTNSDEFGSLSFLDADQDIDTRTKVEKLKAIPYPRVHPSRSEFEEFVSGEAFVGLDYRLQHEDLFITLMERKWRHWNKKTERWDRIRDWRKYLRGLDRSILDAKHTF